MLAQESLCHPPTSLPAPRLLREVGFPQKVSPELGSGTPQGSAWFSAQNV